MTTAYKPLYSCVTFLIFIFVFNFYKNRVSVSRDREVSFRAATKLKRAGALNKPLPLDEAGEDFFFGFSSLDRSDLDEHPPGRVYGGWHWDRLKQYPGRCLDVEVFFLPNGPRSSIDGTVMSPGRRVRVGADQEGLHYRTVQAARRENASDETNSSIYVFLSVLAILLVAAGVDIAKHLTAGRATQEHTQRRLSLQNYQALIREKQKQFRMMKQHCSQPSMSIQRSMDEPGNAQSFSSFPYGVGRGGEDVPGGLQPTGLPAPLLRRQSVPTLMRSHPGLGQGCVPFVGGGSPMGGRNGGRPAPFGRRTSVDSFWDADLHLAKAAVTPCGPGNGSSPEVRRRVRMLHRH